MARNTKLEAAMAARDLGVGEVAKRANRSLNYLSLILNGHAKPSLRTAQAIRRAVGAETLDEIGLG